MATPTHADDRRDAVRHLAAQNLSNREIARRTGISEATVRRWRRDDAPAESDAPATQDNVLTLTLTLDSDLRADLNSMATAGLTPEEAVRTALRIVAGTYENAWALGAVPEGVQPVMIESVIQPHPAGTSTANDCHTPLPHCS
jgi:transposase-like protein